MSKPLHCHNLLKSLYCRAIILISVIALFANTAKATCNAAWTYTVHGDTVFMQSVDTFSANHHFWTFTGNTVTGNVTSQTHVFPNYGTYHICLFVYTPGTSCSDSLCQDITIAAPACSITAAWTYTTHGDTAYFTATDTASATHHFWNFGDAGTASGSTATHVYAQVGSYHVCFYDYIPGTTCSDSLCQNVGITATPPNCHLNTAWTYTTRGDTVYVTAADTNTANHHYWTFGSYTSTSNSLTTSYVFSQPGSYRICLHEYTPGTNCVDSFCQNVGVTAIAPCTLTAAWTFTTRGDTVHFTATDTSASVHHFWNFGDGSAIASGSDATHIYANAGTYHVCFYDYIPNTTCIDSFCQNVSVTVAACHVSAAWTYTIHGDTAFLRSTDTSSANHHYWVITGGTGGNATTLVHVFPNYGTYHICLYVYTLGTNCSDSSCSNITIAAPCSLTSAWTYANHSGDTVHFYAVDTATPIHHYWTFGDGTAVTSGIDPVHLYTAAGTYTVCLHEYIPNTNCVDSFCSTITVGTPCHISAAWTETTHGDTVHFAGVDTNSTAHHIWSFGDGSTGSGFDATHLYTQAGTYHVCFYVYVPGTACSDSFCSTVTIGSGCHVSAAWTYILHGDTVYLTSADTSSANHHIWIFNGNTSTVVSGTTVTHIYTGAGTYHICLYVYTPGTTCTDSSCNNITIINPCNLNAAWQSYTRGDTVHFYAANTDTTVHLDWNLGDGNFGFGQAPTHVYAQAGTYHVCLYAYTGSTCVDSFCSTVTVAGGCHVSAAWTYTLHGDTVFLTSADTSSSNHHFWIFNGSTANYISGTTATYVYPGPGTYHICLLVYTPGTTCTDSSCNNITIASTTCNANAAWTSHDHGDTLFFAASDTSSALNMDWNFGDGTYGFGQYPTHVYAQPGIYHVCLYAYTGTNCIDSFCNTITVSSGCHISASWTYTIHGDTVYLTSTDTGSANHHIWVFNGNTSTVVSGTTATHIYTGAGTYHICLYVYTPGTSCSDSSCNNIIIANTCNVTAAWQYYMRGDTAHFYASGNTTGVSYSWNFGDGHSGTGSNPLHVYAQSGTYHVCLYAYTGTNCIDSFCNTIIVGTGCNVNAAWSYAAYGDSLHFTGTDTNTAAHNYWTFGDGHSGSGFDISHVYAAPGTYTVCHYTYIIGTTCIDSSCNTITITGPCSVTAALNFINLSHDTVAFYALFTDSAANYVWIYGDGTTSTGAYAVHSYPVAGTYHICLHVFIPGTPCADSVCVDVNIGATCAVTAAWTSITRANDSIQFYALDPDTTAHHAWNFGDGTTASGSYAAHTFPTAGTYRVCLYVYIPGTTCSDSLCQNVSSVLGVNDIGATYPAISLRPNPFSQYTIMNIEGPSSTYEVHIYDMLGQLVRTDKGVNNSILIERGTLSSGIYTYAVMAGDMMIGKGKMSIE